VRGCSTTERTKTMRMFLATGTHCSSAFWQLSQLALPFLKEPVGVRRITEEGQWQSRPTFGVPVPASQAWTISSSQKRKGPTRKTNQPRGRISDMLRLVHFLAFLQDRSCYCKKDRIARSGCCNESGQNLLHTDDGPNIRELDAR
jgi:hypothetical protein